ncbi:MAG: type I 3-dehydroquinate dehydratase [Chthoniobacterales bacterium]
MNGTVWVNQKCVVPRLVGVIASPATLVRATRLRRPPDLFEIRLDALRDSLGEVARALPRLRAPLILTARHPSEGGLGRLNAGARRALLRRFLAAATFIDLELRSVGQMETLIDEMRRRRIGLVLSVHDFCGTPSTGELHRLAIRAAAIHPAVLKIVTRIDTAAQLEQLVAFFQGANRDKLPIAAMGIGKRGAESRRWLDRLGSALTYVSLGEAKIEGQPSLGQLRRAGRAYII